MAGVLALCLRRPTASRQLTANASKVPAALLRFSPCSVKARASGRKVFFLPSPGRQVKLLQGS